MTGATPQTHCGADNRRLVFGMTKFAITLLASALLFPAVARDKAPALAPTWSGIITIKRNPFQPQPKVESPLLVVNNQRAYKDLLARIPAKQISRTRPAPENNDPLRKAPKIDFTKNTLLVSIRPSMTKPVFQAVNSNAKGTTVTVTPPANSIVIARQKRQAVSEY